MEDVVNKISKFFVWYLRTHEGKAVVTVEGKQSFKYGVACGLYTFYTFYIITHYAMFCQYKNTTDFLQSNVWMPHDDMCLKIYLHIERNAPLKRNQLFAVYVIQIKK